jgi:diguanylate cyclase (GGDEF)-like protein
MQPGAKFWPGVALTLTLAQIAASALLPRGFALTVASDLVEALVLIMLLAAFAQNAIASRGRLRSFWILQLACWALWLVDQSWWILYDIVLRKPVPAMFFGDVILFLAGVPMLGGLLLRPNLQQNKQSARLGTIDFLLLMLWWIYCYVVLVMCWKYVSANTALYNRNFDRLYQLQFLILMMVLGLLLRRSAGAWRSFYAFFFAGVLFHGLSVVAEYRAVDANLYYNGSWHDIPFVASLAFFLVVANKGRHLMPAAMTAEDEKYGSWMTGLAVVAVLSMPVVVVAVASDHAVPESVAHFRVLVTAATMFGLTALVFVKQRQLHEELQQSNLRLEEACMTDPLTGIRNRRSFFATIQNDVAQTIRAYRTEGDPFARDLVFYLIDLDNFKEVNDSFGHDSGDQVLVETVRRINSAIRDSDVLVRWGGEEFLIVSRHSNRKQADAVAMRVMQAVSGEPYLVNSTQKIRRTCSIGWAAFPWLEDNVNTMGYEAVLTMADRALGQAKRAGKDQAIGMTP